MRGVDTGVDNRDLDRAQALRYVPGQIRLNPLMCVLLRIHRVVWRIEKMLDRVPLRVPNEPLPPVLPQGIVDRQVSRELECPDVELRDVANRRRPQSKVHSPFGQLAVGLESDDDLP